MALFVWLGTMAFLVLLLLAALLSRIHVRVRYAKSGAEDRLIIIIRALYGAYRKQLTFPSVTERIGQLLVEKAKSNKSAEQHCASHRKPRAGTALFRHGQAKLPRLRKIMKKIQCTRFRLDIRAGTGDAALTGVISGVLWGTHGCAVALVERWLKMRTRPHGAVEPVYNGVEFSVVCEIDCRVRVGTLIAALLFGGIRMASLRQSWSGMRTRLEPT